MSKTIEAPDTLMMDGPAAELCGVTRQALQRWRRERRGPPYIRVEGAIRYSRKALEAWLSARTVSSEVAAND